MFRQFFQKNLFWVKMQRSVTTHDTTQMGAVSGGLAKFDTAPVPVEPVTPKPRVYPHPCRTLAIELVSLPLKAHPWGCSPHKQSLSLYEIKMLSKRKV